MTTELPDGVLELVSISNAAKMLNLDERRVRGWVERGKVDSKQLMKGKRGKRGTDRYVRTAEVVRIATRLEIPIDWTPAKI